MKEFFLAAFTASCYRVSCLSTSDSLSQPFVLNESISTQTFTHQDLPDDTLYILDGTSMLTRAYFRTRDEISMAANGVTEVGAVHSMGVELAHFISEMRPKYIAMAFDVDRNSTFRRKLMPSYKSQRPPHPIEFKIQIPLAQEMARALGIQCFKKEGYEADDVMATLGRWGCSAGLSVVIVSDDKDMWQLVKDRVHVMIPRRDNALAGEAEVLAKYGLKPNQLVDLISLMGDSADNIPGIHGIGIKGASALLKVFDTVESIFENLNEVEHINIRGAKVLQQKLNDPGSKDRVLLYKNIATLCQEVPLEELKNLTPSQLRYRGALREAENVLRILGFSSPTWILESFISSS